MGNSAKRDARDLAKAQLREKILQKRRAGASYRRIAAEIGIDVATAHRHVRDAIKEVPLEAAKDVLAIELERLDVMFASLWPKAYGGTEKKPVASAEQSKAIDQVLRIMDRRAKYLGLDAPAKNELTGPDGKPIALSVDAAPTVAKARERMAEVFGSVTPGAAADAADAAASTSEPGSEPNPSGSP